MKNKHILILFVIGMTIVFGGVWMKLGKNDGADILLGIGLLIQAVCMVLLVMKSMKGGNNSGFLDS
ncbi:MAG TPA: hypothetical protein VGB50_07205 [Flavobacterium sp.]|jgi:hypothetical protein